MFQSIERDNSSNHYRFIRIYIFELLCCMWMECAWCHIKSLSRAILLFALLIAMGVSSKPLCRLSGSSDLNLTIHLLIAVYMRHVSCALTACESVALCVWNASRWNNSHFFTHVSTQNGRMRHTPLSWIYERTFATNGWTRRAARACTLSAFYGSIEWPRRLHFSLSRAVSQYSRSQAPIHLLAATVLVCFLICLRFLSGTGPPKWRINHDQRGVHQTHIHIQWNSLTQHINHTRLIIDIYVEERLSDCRQHSDTATTQKLSKVHRINVCSLCVWRLSTDCGGVLCLCARRFAGSELSGFG